MLKIFVLAACAVGVTMAVFVMWDRPASTAALPCRAALEPHGPGQRGALGTRAPAGTPWRSPAGGQTPPVSRLAGQPQSGPPRTIHVDQPNPTASDANPGTAALPLKTIGAAIPLAVADTRKGIPVMVVVHPGIYRENISVPPDGTSAPLILQADVGKVVVSGSDIWRGWTPCPSGQVFVHPWPYAWGLAQVPDGWPRISDIIRRREMVFVNRASLAQVLQPGDMSQGTFYVDEPSHSIYIWPSTGVNPNEQPVEVALRSPLLSASSRQNLTIRGFIFRDAATAVDASAVELSDMTNLVVEDTVFEWNNWGGLGIYTSGNVTVRRSVGNHNGGRGMSAWKVKSLLYEDNDTSYNNWRGIAGGFRGWAVAGVKIERLHGGTFRRVKAVGNRTRGFWLDYDNQDIIVSDGLWCDNDNDGAFVEASRGVVIERTIVCGNHAGGILTATSEDVVLRGSVLYGNVGRQFEVGEPVTRKVTNWETGQVTTLRTERWTFCGDAIVGTDNTQYLMALRAWDFFRTTLKASRNDYWNAQRADAFVVVGDGSGERAMDFESWRRTWGQDVDSVFADPKFVDPSKRDFSSPARLVCDAKK